MFSERDEQMAKEIQHLAATVAKQQTKMEKMQVGAMEDAKSVNDYLNQVHAMVTDVVKRRTSGKEAGQSLDRPEEVTSLVEAAPKGDMRIDVRRSDVCRTGEIVVSGSWEEGRSC